MAAMAQNALNGRDLVSSPRGAAAREFAALEYRGEDFRWIASQMRPAPARKGGFRARWTRFRRSIGFPAETELEADPVPDIGTA
jgi:hypothetical protein